MDKTSLVIRRDSHHENTFALVEVAGQWEERALLETLKKAVTEWINTTEEGRDAWENSVCDFNIGDLAGEDYSSGTELGQILEKHGICDLSVETAGSQGCLHWVFDTVLAREEEIAVQVECSLCGEQAEAATAHLHQGRWVGEECCWDERLRASE